MSRPALDFSFGPDFQESMLALMIEDGAFTQKVTKFIPEERLYSEAHRYLFKLIKEKFDSKTELLTWVEVEDKVKMVERHKRKMLKSFCRRIFSMKADNPDFIKQGLTEYAKKNAFVDIFMTAQTFWNSKEHEKAFTYTMEGINHLYGISFRDDAVLPIEKFEEVRQVFVAEALSRHRRIPTLIDSLDNILRGGLEKGELAIALAEPKKGKSICLVHMACAALMARSGRVAYFLLEGTTEQAVLRFLTRLSGVPYRRLELDELTDEEREKVADVERKYLGRLDLIPFNQHWNYTVIDIETRLKELENLKRKPDLVCIDYADLLRSQERSLEKRHEQTEVYRDLKRLAVMRKLAIWTASQATRPKEGPSNEYLLRAKDISESYEKVRIADLVATLNQTPKEKENGLLRFHLDIYRSNDSDQTITLLTDFERMIFFSKRYGEASHKTDLDHAWMKRKKRGRRS